MLDKLTSVDWEKLGAPHIPQLLRELTSNDRGVQDKAYANLGQSLIPWSALEGVRRPSDLLWLVSRDAVPETVPFLIELLLNESVTSKDYILSLLTDVACYVEADLFMPKTPPTEKNAYRKNARRVYDAVAEGISIYQNLSHSENPRVAEMGKQILETLVDLKGIIQKWSDQEANPSDITIA